MSSKTYTHADYQKLRDEIWYHNKLYYVDNQPVISDEESDHLLKRLEKWSKTILSGSPPILLRNA